MMDQLFDVAVIGLGRLGLPFALVLADAGYCVLGVDIDAALVSQLNNGHTSSTEPEVSDLLSANYGKRFCATTDVVIAMRVPIIFVLVNTPSDVEGRFSNANVLKVLDKLWEVWHSPSHPTIVISSTIMPGSVKDVFIPYFEKLTGLTEGIDFDMLYNPETVALGAVISGYRHPDFVLVGGNSDSACAPVVALHRSIGAEKVCIMSLSSAELAKVALNMYITMKLSFANLLGLLCDAIPDCNVDAVTSSIGLDSRIGGRYFRSGTAYGGPCFPRDVSAFDAELLRRGLSTAIPQAVAAINFDVTENLAVVVIDIARELNVQYVGIYGMSFKAGTPVTDASPTQSLIDLLAEAGLQCEVYDPMLPSNDVVKVFEQKVIVLMHYDKNLLQQLTAHTFTEQQVIVDPWRQVGALCDAARTVALGRNP